MSNGQHVRIHGIVDSIPNAPPADIIFILRERKHATYTRKNYDLAMEITLSYSESIVGYKRRIKCLYGNEIVIGNPIVVSAEANVEEDNVSTASFPDEVNANDRNETDITTAATIVADEQGGAEEGEKKRRQSHYWSTSPI